MIYKDDYYFKMSGTWVNLGTTDLHLYAQFED